MGDRVNNLGVTPRGLRLEISVNTQQLENCRLLVDRNPVVTNLVGFLFA